MSCGGRVYKGDLVIVSIPFDVSGYTDLAVSYFTTGDIKIVRTESELTIEDGYITASFDGHDLDILPDGVIRYTINYSVDNTDYVESTNTMLYLKTPMGYSAVTPEEIYQSGYTEGYSSGYTTGLNDCSGVTPCDCSSAITEAYQSGYTEGYSSGYTQGLADCPECSGGICTNIQQQKIVYFNTRPGAGEATIYPDSGYDGVYEAVANIDGALYEAQQEGYNNGYAEGKQDYELPQFVMSGSITFSADTQINGDNMYRFAYYYGIGTSSWGFWQSIGDHALLEYEFYPAGTYDYVIRYTNLFKEWDSDSPIECQDVDGLVLNRTIFKVQ